jgi:hypothetical protein
MGRTRPHHSARPARDDGKGRRRQSAPRFRQRHVRRHAFYRGWPVPNRVECPFGCSEPSTPYQIAEGWDTRDAAGGDLACGNDIGKGIRPEFGALFAPPKSIRAGENLFAWDSGMAIPTRGPLAGDLHHSHDVSQSQLQPIHNRMPVILDEAGAADWLNLRESDPLSLKRLLGPVPDDSLVVGPASPLVNSVKNEGPALLEYLSLFGE